MLSSDVIATSRYYLNQLQHNLSDLRNFDSFGFLAIFGYETSRGFCEELVLDIFNQYPFNIYRLINIIIIDFDDYNMHIVYIMRSFTSNRNFIECHEIW